MALLEQNSIFSSITPQFDLGVTSTIQQNSLASLNQDLNGNPGPLFDMGKDSTIHNPDSLFALNAPGAPDQDLNGESGPIFDKGFESTLQKDQLMSTEELSYTPTDLLTNTNTALGIPGIDEGRGPGFDLGKDSTLHGIPNPESTQNSPYQDLDGVDGGQGFFHGIPNPGMYQGKQVNGIDLHVSLLKDQYAYQHGNAPTVLVNAGKQDLDGVPGPTFNAGKESPQDIDSPVFDTIHENSLLRKYKDPNRMDLDLDGEKGFFQRPTDVTDTLNLMSLNQVPKSPSGFADVNGINRIQPKAPDGASIDNPGGYFHGIANPTKGQGLQIMNKDLHVHLLNEGNQWKGVSGTTLDLNIPLGTNTPPSYLDTFNLQDLPSTLTELPNRG
jgi:hypothetical protein